MKYKLLLITALFFNLIYSQTTHELPWGMSSTNQQLTIDVGDTVVWNWVGGTHNVRATGGVEDFDSGYFTGPGPHFSHTFTSPGATMYICDPHATSMYGTITVMGTASNEELNYLDLNLFPNPSPDYLNLTFKYSVDEQIFVEVYDITGKLIKNQNISTTNNKSIIDIRDLNRGIYILKVYTVNAISVKRFIRE